MTPADPIAAMQAANAALWDAAAHMTPEPTEPLHGDLVPLDDPMTDAEADHVAGWHFPKEWNR